MALNASLDRCGFCLTETEYTSQGRGPLGAIEPQDGLARCSHDMYMSGAVIIGIDDHPQRIQTKYSRHVSTNQSGWVLGVGAKQTRLQPMSDYAIDICQIKKPANKLAGLRRVGSRFAEP